MIVLGIETSTVAGSVAVVRDETLVGEIYLATDRSHSEQILESIKVLLEALRLGVSHLEGIAVGLGPGSFTGLRVGLATAKGLAIALDIPIVGVGSLDSLAQGAHFWNGIICAMSDAKGEKVCGALYEVAGGVVEKKENECVRELGPWILSLPRPVFFVGEASVRYRGRIRGLLGDFARFAPAECSYPRASLVARMGMERLKRGLADDLEALVPVYAHEPQAKRDLRERGSVS